MSCVYRTFEQQTHWEQESCPFLGGCPYLRCWLASNTFNLRLNLWKGVTCVSSNQWFYRTTFSKVEQNGLNKRLMNYVGATCLNLTVFLPAVLISILSWRLFCISYGHLGARFLSVVQSLARGYPYLWGWKHVTSMVKSIGGTCLVCCLEVICMLEVENLLVLW